MNQEPLLVKFRRIDRWAEVVMLNTNEVELVNAGKSLQRAIHMFSKLESTDYVTLLQPWTESNKIVRIELISVSPDPVCNKALYSARTSSEL